MARCVAADLGLRGATPGGPSWRHDNPFFWKAARAEARRASFFLRLFFTALTLSGLLVGGLTLQAARPEPLALFARWFAVSPAGMLFLAVSTVHAFFVLGARAALTNSLATEARRQTLEGLLMTPLQRAEFGLAMAVFPCAGALLVGLAGLPVYVAVYEFGGLEWRDLGWLFVLFLLMSFAPPTYALPALSGAAATPDAPQRQATGKPASTGTGAGPTSAIVGFVYLSFLTTLFGRGVSGLGGWVGHLKAALPPSFGAFGPLFILSLPYALSQSLGAPRGFFRGGLAPLTYLLPLLVAGWVASALRTGAALSAGDPQELARLPAFRRAATLSRWSRRVGLLCFLGFVWKPWVLGGDTGRLLGDVTANPDYGAAGLLLLLGSVAILVALGKAFFVGIRGKTTAKLRPPVRLVRRVTRLALRPLRLALLIFGLTCLFGQLSPFVPPVYHVLGRLALVALASILFAAGLVAASGRLRPRTVTLLLLFTLLPVGLPFLALSLPAPSACELAALSPSVAWLELFPGSAAWIHLFPYWKLGTLPPFWLCIAGPTLLGLTGFVWGYSRKSAPTPETPAKAAKWQAVQETLAASLSGVKSAAPVQHEARTAALMGWLTERVDNPLFIHELRTRTRSGQWFQWAYIVPTLLVFGIGAATFYPDVANAFAHSALLHFFREPFGARPRAGQPYADLAAIVASWQVYLTGLSGVLVGENLILQDQQRGTLGFILLTPLGHRQIFWGKLAGQTSGYFMAWLIVGACTLLLYALAAPGIGLVPALTAWAVGQLLTFSLFVLGLSLGTALATHTLLLKSLRGLSLLLMVAAVAGSLVLISRLLPFDFWGSLFSPSPDSWRVLALSLTLLSLYSLVLSLPAFAYAQWRLAVLRRRDIPFGDALPD